MVSTRPRAGLSSSRDVCLIPQLSQITSLSGSSSRSPQEERLYRQNQRNKRRYQDEGYRKQCAARARAWHAANRDRARLNKIAWREANPTYFRDYFRRRLATIEGRLLNRLRSRLSQAIKRRHEPTLALVGCSLQHLMDHLEGQFKEGMSWFNYGAWHVDHRIPFASIDLRDPIALRTITHWTNLQPLWAKDNLSKGCK